MAARDDGITEDVAREAVNARDRAGEPQTFGGVLCMSRAATANAATLPEFYAGSSQAGHVNRDA
jgi:hypothetical protein